MHFYADLHIHSKYSRATSRDCDLEHLGLWAQRKGLTVVATGDFTHPAWFGELQEKLVAAEPGLFRLRPELEREVAARVPAACQRPVRFALSGEISTIYKKAERTRKVHHLLYMPDFASASKARAALARIGNIASDGRPILGLDSRDLLEVALESGPGAFLVPAHLWTPWFAALGSKSGFDSIEDCYGDLAPHVFAAETGLSSDPPMNWRVSALDRLRLISNSDAHSPGMLAREACLFDTELDFFSMRRALETGAGWGGTVEFFPEEGKYHLDGHRACQVRLMPKSTRELGGLCPECGKPVTVGVMHRVEQLADRAEGLRPEGAAPFRSLVPLAELVAEIHRVGAGSERVARDVAALEAQLGPELPILERLPLEEIRRAGAPLLVEAIARLRRGQVHREGGYDGEYGAIRMFEPRELERSGRTGALFSELQSQAPASRGKSRSVPRPDVELPSPAEARRAPEGGGQPSPGGDQGDLGDLDGLMRGLDPDQRAAAQIQAGPLLIVAGPGTGKTRTLTHRLAHLIRLGQARPEQCLAITFTRRAAEEMSRRLEALIPGHAGGVLVATFHGLGLRLAEELREKLGLPEVWRVASESERVQIVAELFGGAPADAGKRLERFSRGRRGAAGPDPEREAYARAMRDRGLLDFDDLLELPVRLLREDAAEVERLRRRFRWICIDEYQDVDALQYELLRLLSPPGGNLCAIGDPDQAIYGFRGADVGFFLRFQEDFPAARSVQLGRNYRSSRPIVEAAVQAVAPSALVRGRALAACGNVAGPERVLLHEAAGPRAEAEFAVQAIEQLLGGTSHRSLDAGRVQPREHGSFSFSDVAVLTRTDAQAAVFGEALARAGMPFQKRSHDRLGDRPGVARIARWLRDRGLQGQSVAEALQTGCRAMLEETPQATELLGAAELLAPIAERHGKDLAAFLAELSLDVEIDTWDPRADRVSLLTLHASKGLEFPVVFLAGCEDGLIPLRFAGRETDVAEERRLFFVGMTRAQNYLFLTRARERERGGKAEPSAASPFLADIQRELLEEIGAKQPTRNRRAQARQLALF